MEPNEDMHSLIKALQEKSHSKNQPFIPTEYTRVVAEVASATKELEQRNQIFEGAPSMDAYIKPEIKKEVEVVPVHTDDELVAKVFREQTIERREIVEKEEDKCEEKEEELEMGVKDILALMAKLHKALLS